jgi:RecG-like helicase
MDASPATGQPAASHTDRPRSLSTPLERLPGVGTARAEKLIRLDLVTASDALMHFPREYRDFSGAHAFADFREGEHASIAGEVTSVASRTTAGGRPLLTVLMACNGGHVRGVWFNMPFMNRRFVAGMKVVFAGVPKKSGPNWEFSHPEVRWLSGEEQPHASDWLAIYPLAEGVPQAVVRAAVQAALVHTELGRQDVALIEAREHRLEMLAAVVTPPQFVDQNLHGNFFVVRNIVKNAEVFKSRHRGAIQNLRQIGMWILMQRVLIETSMNTMDIFPI